MYNEYQKLSKSDKKVVRELIDKGIASEFKKGMEELDLIMQKWRDEGVNDQQHYAELYGAIRDFDKYIARRYDDLRGSRYVSTLTFMIADDIVSISDLDGLSTEFRDEMASVVKKIKDSN
ncbi:hypothetical protein [Mucilaginibacter dorajii]|uniref:Uncharacterized protein n=1 Tax=Mucilaginibacter dorajii TaxID=692994 RepID=A0ABP7QLU0_9SPHI|nr:hypothetical protein [Mucilaginibacter dorajii]MCS3735940.1 hypothetical protein [Mucilaginibacter dorajii]